MKAFALRLAFGVLLAACLGTCYGQSESAAIRQGFAAPPAGYGEVPFWWWTGEKLDVDRLLWQLDELKKKGISGVQVNYAHQDVRNEKQPNWLTYPNEPEVLTDEWFDVFEKVAEHCDELKMGAGLSGYTLDWQHSPNNLFDRLIYSDVDTQSRTLYVGVRKRVAAGQKFSEVLGAGELGDREDDKVVQIAAYPVDAQGTLDAAGVLTLDRASLDQAAETDCEAIVYRAKRSPYTLNPLHPDAGKKVVERFLKPFEDRAKKRNAADDGKSTLGLEYFFQDELQLGTGDLVWHDDVPDVFARNKGYSYWSAAPAMFGLPVGDLAEKYRLDFMNVRVKLAEERYFIPIYRWHADRGRIYGCDPGSRGRDPSEFCDYFSAIRWYTAPGHDTPGGRADFIKNKVSSSIAHFYNRPRVWLEGYHSFGWGAEPKQLFQATNENYLYGANLLNLHGLYYTTYGGYWEWAPPCYHFRQPWWETFGSFLKYFERLSFALTRGVEQTDVVILYPVSPYHANLDGPRARDVAFEAASRVYATGRDVLFIDDESVARAEVRDGKLCVAGGEHGVLILPSIKGIHWSTLEKAFELLSSGGTVIALDALPIASDRAGRNDTSLDTLLKEIFDFDPSEMFTDTVRIETSISRTPNGGVGAFFSPFAPAAELDGSDKIGPGGVISKIREYDGGFAGRWVWSPELKQNVYFKWVADGLGDKPREYPVRFLCDNSGALYVNGRKICENANYSVGWTGTVTLRDGDVITLDCHDDDAPRPGSAGMFFSLLRDGVSFASAEDFGWTDVKPTDEFRKSVEGYDKLGDVSIWNVHVLHRTGVNSEAAGNPKQDAARNDAQMWAKFTKFIEEYPRDVFDAESGAPCAVMKRTFDGGELYFVMKGKKGSKLAFRSLGKVEFMNPWDGSFTEAVGAVCPQEGKLAGTTVVPWPYNENEAGLVVFWTNEKPTVPLTALSVEGGALDGLVIDSNGKLAARVLGDGIAGVTATTSDGAIHRLVGAAKSKRSALPLDGDWSFELMPTLDNRWGDFRLPIAEQILGAEAQRLTVEGAGEFLYDFGPKFQLIGPFPADADLAALESKLAAPGPFDPAAKVALGDKEYTWRPYSFSWRWGVEGNPGREGYHGLKEKIDSRFIALGKPKEAHNETVYAPEEGGSVYYLRTTAPVELAPEGAASDAERVDVYVSGGAPAAIYVGGTKFEDGKTALVRSEKNTPVLLRYDAAGRYACVFRARAEREGASRLVAADGADSGAYNGLSTGLREETPDFAPQEVVRTPLSTVWFDLPNVLPYDVYGADSDRGQTTRLSFVAPPGLKKLSVPSYGKVVAVSVDGASAEVARTERVIAGDLFWRGERGGAEPTPASVKPNVYWTELELAEPVERESTVTLELETPARLGLYCGALCPEPIRLTCGRGVTTLGDWNARGTLANYSGGARYGKSFVWNAAEHKSGRAILAIGAVGSSCRVFLNGEQVADVPAPPKELDVTDFLRDGENTLEIDVYTALANFYRNIPSRYKNAVPCGLIGPVELRFEPTIIMGE